MLNQLGELIGFRAFLARQIRSIVRMSSLLVSLGKFLELLYNLGIQ